MAYFYEDTKYDDNGIPTDGVWPSAYKNSGGHSFTGGGRSLEVENAQSDGGGSSYSQSSYPSGYSQPETSQQANENAFSNNYMVGDGGYIVDYNASAAKQNASPAKAANAAYNDIAGGNENAVVGDNGYIIDHNSQYNPFQVDKTLRDVAAYWTPDEEVTKKYNQIIDWGASKEENDLRTLDRGIVGDGGFVIDPHSGMPSTDVAQDYETYGGNLIDHGSGALTEGQARSAWMDKERALWYLDNGFVPEENAEAYKEWIRGAGNNALDKAYAEENFGFERYAPDVGGIAANTFNSFNTRVMSDAASGLANVRSNLVEWDAKKDDGTIVKMNTEYENELLDLLKKKQQDNGYVMQDGNFIDVNTIEKSMVGLSQDGDSIWVNLDDGQQLFLCEDTNENIQRIQAIDPNYVLDEFWEYTGGDDTITDKNGLTWTYDELIRNTNNPQIIAYLTGQGSTHNTDQQGENVDYGFAGFNRPSSHASNGEDMVGTFFENPIGTAIDWTASSLPYFSPFTAIPMTASQVASIAQGVNTMQGGGNGYFPVVQNTAVGAPMQALAGVGEMALGGAATGRAGAEGRGLFETLADQSALGRRWNASMNPLVKIAREAGYEGLEEATTDPLYEIAANADYAYVPTVQKENKETGEMEEVYDESKHNIGDQLRAGLSNIPGNLLAGAVIGGPMAGIKEARHPVQSVSAWQEYKAKNAEEKNIRENGFDVDALNEEIERWGH